MNALMIIFKSIDWDKLRALMAGPNVNQRNSYEWGCFVFFFLHFMLWFHLLSLSRLSSFTVPFCSINRTMCPRNVTVLDADLQGTGQGGVAEYDDTAEFLFFIDVFSSSLEPVHYSIEIDVVPQFFIE